MPKRVLITGKTSYVGEMYTEWMKENNPEIKCESISVRGNEWKEYDFSNYDCVLHLAGIAHVNSKDKSDSDYYNINTDLAIEVAKKAENDGVFHFIFMSSIIVYNDSEMINGKICKETVPLSNNAYGDSKIRAERGIQQLESDKFIISILRPPMIYGKNSKGNFPKLYNLAKKTPIFPNYGNTRSMIFIDNLSQFISLLVRNPKKGIFFPQNTDYISTPELVKTVADLHNNRLMFTKIFNPIINITKKTRLVNKVFGNLYYEDEICQIDTNDYNSVSFIDSIVKSKS